jgi:hypothetical protein
VHGDFRSRRLKNTSDELRHQDVRLRQILVDSCRRFGLVVAGYSGRDDSVMGALEEALERPGAFPAGLFWLHRGEEPPLPRVIQLLTHAAVAGVESALVMVDNFDEALRDLVRLVKGIDTTVLDTFAVERRRWSGAPYLGGSRGWPVVRLNALPVVQAPSVCRRVVCQIGGSGCFSNHVLSSTASPTTTKRPSRTSPESAPSNATTGSSTTLSPFGRSCSRATAATCARSVSETASMLPFASPPTPASRGGLRHEQPDQASRVAA